MKVLKLSAWGASFSAEYPVFQGKCMFVNILSIYGCASRCSLLIFHLLYKKKLDTLQHMWYHHL